MSPAVWLLAVFVVFGSTNSAAYAQDTRTRDAQEMLRTLGYSSGTPDGLMGPRTRSALREFQSAAGQTTTGELDIETFRLLQERVTSTRGPTAPASARPSVPVTQPGNAAAVRTTATPAYSPPLPASPRPPSVNTAPPEGTGISFFWLVLPAAAVFLLWRRRVKHRAREQDTARTPSETPALRIEITSSLSSFSGADATWRRAAKTRQIGRWVQAEETILVNGKTVSGGWFYVGDHLPATSGYGNENCLINPDLPMARSDADNGGSNMSYYPSYERIDPRCRLAYLDWLAGARNNPSTNIGYIFLYFYGIERRLMLDRSSGDRSALIGEIERLRKVYGSSGSFDRYSRALLDAAALLDQSVKLYERNPSFGLRFLGEIPLGVRAAIGQLIHEKKPVPGPWALAWLLGHPETRLGSPARRAFPEFRELFLKRFAATFPEGLRLETPKRRLSAQYSAASGTFSVALEGPFRAWPDVRDLRKPLEAMHTIAEGCVADLAAYSRYLGKDDANRASLEAAAWLPAELLQQMENNSIRSARANLERLIPADRIRLSARQLLDALGMSLGDAKLSRKEGQVISQILERLGYGIEPDLRATTVGDDLDRSLVVYRLSGHEPAPSQPSGMYQSGLLIANLAAIILHADGTVGPAEEARMMQQIDAIPSMSTAERTKLKAHAAWLVTEPPRLSRLRERLASLSENARRALAEFAIAVAAADGSIGPSEVKTLEKVYSAMGLPRECVHSDIHAFHVESTHDDEPVLIQEAVPSVKQGRQIPVPLRASSPTIKLDLSRITRIQADTQQAAALLSTIFVEEVPLQSEPEPAHVVDDELDPLDGLDTAHTALVRELIVREQWPRTEFERLVRSFDLLPDGALETINDWAFGRFDDLLIENGEPLIVYSRRLKTPEMLTS